jgi:membrane protein DedA with SNARE-associated domain
MQFWSAAARHATLLPFALSNDTARAAALALGTLVSEDLSCIGAGELIRRGELSPIAGILGCFAGIYFGDLGLWLLGRTLGARLLCTPWLARRLPPARIAAMGDWFDRRAGAAVFAARFLPGTRLPLYVAAGTLGRKGGRFALWTLAAAALWTPLIVLSAASLGQPLARAFERLPGLWSTLAIVATLYTLVRLAALAATAHGRRRIAVCVARLSRWEFWPAWLFYAPVALWVTGLSLRRGGPRGFASVTAANPGIPHGGFVGESKFQILSALDPRFTVPAELLPAAPLPDRLAQLRKRITHRGWAYPIILKPDVGQRGAGVRLARSETDAAEYLAAHPAATIAQPYHPGPFEAGVFYYRFPGEPRGRIFSITDKHFPQIVGDGVSTVAELVRADRRYRLQSSTFLARHANRENDVLPRGGRLSLAVAGNHCQGTLFRDGAHLITPALEHRIDEIARGFPGFYFGRFDVRYSDAGAFKAGSDLAIIELNGVTSESTNIYDPAWPLWRAYRVLFRQWSILFSIADACLRTGAAPTRPIELFRLVRNDFARRPGNGPSD